MKYRKSLYVFRQDLRILDNTALYHACHESKEVIPLFIFDTEILQHLPVDDQRVGFIIDACRSLDQQLHEFGSQLYVLHGNPVNYITQLLDTKEYDALYLNKAYDSYGQARDGKLRLTCQAHAVEYHEYDDFLLVEPEAVEVRKVFTPFYRLRQQQPKRTKLLEITSISTPSPSFGGITQLQLDNDTIYQTLNAGKNKHRPVDFSDQRITHFAFSDYQEARNFPAVDGSSKLSPYTRFGLLSIRQLHNAVLEAVHGSDRKNTPGLTYQDNTVTTIHKDRANIYVSELARREFWQHIAHYFPNTKQQEFQEKRRNIQWDNNQERFEKWKQGKTGYPIVDAGMRQLKSMNWMHNRVRMIVASFLTKDLLIDRRRGEQHFADYLIDYDENVNIGNRQRAASVGADPKPLRIFNPILQSERYDADAKYILKRCPELNGQDLKAIHNPIKYDLNYHTPIVDHYTTSKQAKLMYYHEPYSLA